MEKLLKISDLDNVAVALADLKKGEEILFANSNITALDDIPFGHKIALADIEKLIEGNNNVLAIVMDGLEQPGNIGAILRSFDCAGGDFAIVTNKQAKLGNSRLVRSSLGASFMLPVLEAEIGETQDWLENHGFKCVVTDLQAKQNYREIDYSGRIAIISGNEHTGISDSWRKLPHSQSIIIPMLGSVESLNVGFASTLVSYEAGLQKFGNKK